MKSLYTKILFFSLFISAAARAVQIAYVIYKNMPRREGGSGIGVRTKRCASIYE